MKRLARKLLALIALCGAFCGFTAPARADPLSAFQTQVNTYITPNGLNKITGANLNAAFNLLSPIFSSIGSWDSNGVFHVNVTALPVTAFGGSIIDSTSLGVSAKITDSSVFLQTAVNVACSAGGGHILLPAGTIYASNILLCSSVYITGAGRTATIVKNVAGSNRPVFYGPANVFALFGTQVDGGLVDSGLSEMTIDGNMANQSSGDCVDFYGYRFHWNNLAFTNCHDNGYRTEGGYPTNAPMEGTFHNILVDTTGQNGIAMDGPHDSDMDNIIVVDACQSANATWSGLYFGTHMNARIKNFHGWHRSTVINRCAQQAQLTGYATNFSLSQFEGAYNQNLLIGPTSQQNTFDCSNEYYAAWNGRNVAVQGPSNIICGFFGVPGAGRPASVALTLGYASSDNAAANMITMNVLQNGAGAVDFTHDGGNNMIRVSGYQSTGVKYIGTANGGDDIDLVIAGGATGANIHQHP